MLDYIPDGYTQRGFIKAQPGLHGDFRFEFRPMTVEDRAVVFEKKLLERPQEEQDRMAAKAMTSRITSWGLVNADGGSVKVSTENLLRLKPALFRRLFDMVAGFDGGDPDHDTTTEVRGELLDERLEAALAGRPIGELREVADEKN